MLHLLRTESVPGSLGTSLPGAPFAADESFCTLKLATVFAPTPAPHRSDLLAYPIPVAACAHPSFCTGFEGFERCGHRPSCTRVLDCSPVRRRETGPRNTKSRAPATAQRRTRRERSSTHKKLGLLRLKRIETTHRGAGATCAYSIGTQNTEGGWERGDLLGARLREG